VRREEESEEFEWRRRLRRKGPALCGRSRSLLGDPLQARYRAKTICQLKTRQHLYSIVYLYHIALSPKIEKGAVSSSQYRTWLRSDGERPKFNHSIRTTTALPATDEVCCRTVSVQRGWPAAHPSGNRGESTATPTDIYADGPSSTVRTGKQDSKKVARASLAAEG
jgi:hypothetical protein